VARLIVDTSGYLAGLSRTHPLRPAIRDILAQADQAPVISPLVIAELDYLVLSRAGVKAEIEMLDDLTGGAYDLAEVDLDDVRAARGLAARYPKLEIGVTDAMNMVLADRYQTNELLTLDQRHFRAAIPLTTRFPAFRLLPFDQQ
jgi:predicted nucleic acid-binding protein